MSSSPDITRVSAEYTFRLNRVLLYIEQHLAEDLSLAVLARESCFSAFHFHRIFQALTGETPLNFVKRVRLERAASLLQTSPAQSVTQIALACGFPSPAAFSRSFRERFGVPPRDFRTNSKNCKPESKDSKVPAGGAGYLAPVFDNQQEKDMQVTITPMPARHVAYVANLEGYDNEHVGRAWERLCGWAGPLGLLETGEMIGISFDDPGITAKNKCRYYACVTIPPGTETPRDIGVMDLPAGRHAVAPFDGTTSEIQAAYSQLYGSWLPQSGFEPADAQCFEIYHSTPDDDPEGHFVMDICMPVRAVGRAAR